MSQPMKDFEKGKKSLKTGIFKWKPNYVEAASHFESAAKGFEGQGDFDKAIEAYIELGKVYENLHEEFLISQWAGGRAYESVALITLRTENIEASVTYTEKAVECFRISGKADKAMRMYLFMGNEAESRNLLELACRMYASALRVMSDDELFAYCKDIIGPYASILLEHKLFTDVIALYEKEIKIGEQLDRPNYGYKASVAIVSVKLLNGEGYEEALRDVGVACPSFFGSNYYEALSELLEGYEKGNEEEFNKAARRAIWNEVEAPVRYIELVRMVRGLKVKESELSDLPEQDELDFS